MKTTQSSINQQHNNHPQLPTATSQLSPDLSNLEFPTDTIPLRSVVQDNWRLIQDVDGWGFPYKRKTINKSK